MKVLCTEASCPGDEWRWVWDNFLGWLGSWSSGSSDWSDECYCAHDDKYEDSTGHKYEDKYEQKPEDTAGDKYEQKPGDDQAEHRIP